MGEKMSALKGKDSLIPHEYEELYRKIIEIQRKDSLYSITPGIIHDLNNVISIIIGYIELAKMQSVNEPSKLHSTLDIIEKASLRASQLLSNVLGYAKGGRGEKRTIDLNQIVIELKNLIEKVLEKNIIIEVELSPNPQFIEAEPQEIFQVLLNLCLNARDAMPDGGKLRIETSTVSLHTKDFSEFKPGNYVLLSISDTGIGMDEETKRKIFTPFFSTKPKGSGLGLSVVWSVVKSLGGYIDVESFPGKGTTFKIFLPPSTPKNEIKEIEREKEMKGNEKILVVDDEEDIRNVTKEILEH
jgi:signal transduction histidine kinase